MADLHNGGMAPPAESTPGGVKAADEPHKDSADASGGPKDDVPDGSGNGSKDAGRKEEKGGKGGPLSFLKELPGLLIVALILALLIKTFLVQAFYIPSESMEPTLDIGDRVLVNKVVYHVHPIRRGDIIVFPDPHPIPVHRNPLSAFWHWLTSGLGRGTSADKDFIKRVIGLPGDTVEGRHGVIYVNGQPLDEPYLAEPPDPSGFVARRVPGGKLFVMGDNRTHSADSRTLLGFIDEDKVIGRAFVIIWPPSHWTILHRPSFPNAPSSLPAIGLTALILIGRRRPVLPPPGETLTGRSPGWRRAASFLRRPSTGAGPRGRSGHTRPGGRWSTRRTRRPPPRRPSGRTGRRSSPA